MPRKIPRVRGLLLAPLAFASAITVAALTPPDLAPPRAAALAKTTTTASAAAAGRDMFDLVKIAEGVYAAVARPAFPMNCNAGVIINEDDVLVVDSHTTPRAAAALERQLKTITPLPVRFVVNTHFHSDHARGNQAYVRPYPRPIALIATERTRENLATLDVERLAKEVSEIEGKIAAAKDAFEKIKTPEAKNKLEDMQRYQAELKTIKVVLPTVTFDKSLVIHKKARDIVVLYLGRAHTNGDAVVYLPREKVVVTGDLVTRWGPGMGDGFPNEWPRALDELLKLDVQQVIGGHGAPGGRELVTNLRAYITELIAEVKKEVARGAPEAEAIAALKARLVPKHTAAFSAGEFEPRFDGNVKKVYEDVKAGRY